MESRLVSWIAIAALGLMLSGCAAGRSVQQTVSGWFGAPHGPGIGQSQTRYSAAAGVALHRKPDASSQVVGKLELHEQVLRYQREADFAYVTSKLSGLAGWVRERQLIERLPAATKPDTPEAPEPSPPPEKSIFDPY